MPGVIFQAGAASCSVLKYKRKVGRYRCVNGRKSTVNNIVHQETSFSVIKNVNLYYSDLAVITYRKLTHCYG